MALLPTSGGHLFVDPQDPSHTVVEPEDTEAIAHAADARVREASEQGRAAVARSEEALSVARDAAETAARVDRRVDSLEVLSGARPGDVSDATVAGLLDREGSMTRESASALVSELARSILEDAADRIAETAAVPVELFGAVGDGVTDDTAALQAAGASGKVVVFDGTRTYCFTGQLHVQDGAQWITRGATLRETTSVNNWAVVVGSDVTIDRLHLSSAGGEACRGVLIDGSNVEIGDIEVTARARAGAMSDHRRRAVSVGREGTGCQDVRIGEIRVSNYLRGVALWEASDTQIGRIDVNGFVQGAYLHNPSHVVISGGNIEAPHRDIMTGSPGENGFLIEAEGDSFPSGNITLENITVSHSPEHAFRIGGQTTITGIRITKCRAVEPGQGNAAGGCGFKVLGPTSILSATARHENIRFLDCEVHGGVWKETTNFAGFNVGKCSNVLISNPIVRPAPGGSKATYFGVAMIGIESVQITNPLFESTAGPAIGVYDAANTDTAHWGTDPTAISIDGGLIRNCARGVQVKESGTVRRLTVDGTTIEAGDHSVWVQDTATMDRCVININAFYPTTATTYGCAAVMGQITGDIVGPSLMRSGSTSQDYASGALRVFRDGAWRSLATT